MLRLAKQSCNPPPDLRETKIAICKGAAMNTQQKFNAEAWPIARPSTSHRPILEKVIIESHHSDGNGTVTLGPDQSLYVHSRLSNVVSAFLRGHDSSIHNFGVEHLPADHEQSLSACGAKVWPIRHESRGVEILEKVVIESNHSDGHGPISLSPEQASYIYSRLTHINLAFLHENVWGGESLGGQ